MKGDAAKYGLEEQDPLTEALDELDGHALFGLMYPHNAEKSLLIIRNIVCQALHGYDRYELETAQ